MRGSLVQRYKGTWSIVLDLGYQADPATATRRRKQRWITIRGTRRDAENRLGDLLRDAQRGELVVPHKRTFGERLGEWVRKGHKTPGQTRRGHPTAKSRQPKG